MSEKGVAGLLDVGTTCRRHHTVYMVLGMEPKALCMLGKLSTC